VPGTDPERAERAARARAALTSCRLCVFRCGVDRTSGPAGRSRADAEPRVFHEGVEWAGETALVPTYVVSFAGCNLTCSFCLTGAESQDASRGRPLDAAAIAARIAATPSLRSVTILGGEPTIHLAGALELAARVDLPLVWKTNATASDEGLVLLEGVPSVVLADWKFGNDACADRLAGIPRYGEVVRANLARFRDRLIVRHLLMPGHLECCTTPVVEALARELPGVALSLMTGFLPVFRAAEDGLGRTNRASESARAWELVRGAGVPVAPWSLAPREARPAWRRDELWIDRDGRVNVDSASSELVAALARLTELRLA
jgi:putative pyruvate formate lyase activating enzyme